MKVLSANRLTDGEVVWLAAGTWAESIEAAEIIAAKDAAARLAAAQETALEHNDVVDIAIVDVELAGEIPVPIRLRERIRAAGPTNRLDLGKQSRRQRLRAL